MVTRILSILSLLIALGLAAYLVYDIYEVIDKANEIERVEKKVTRKLSLIREAQEAHQKMYGTYANTWDSLRMFIRNDQFPIVEVKEEIFTLDYGADSVVITRDTIDFHPVIDSLYTEAELAFLNLDRLEYVPHPTKNDIKFELHTSTLQRGPYTVSVIEVIDSKPFDKTRDDENERPTRRRLRFGSLNEVSTAGNWE